MQIDLTGHHVEITDSLRGYAQEKLARIERYFDSVMHVRVVLSVEKLRHKAEAAIHVAGGDIFAEAVEEDMYAAIDILSDKIERQIKKYKEKLTAKHRTDKTRTNP